MPTTAKSHAEMQNSVCILCFRKPSHLRNITPRLKLMISKVLPIPWSTDDKWAWLPTKICGGCCIQLDRTINNPRHILSTIDHSSLTPPQSQHIMETRSRLIVECVCSVCTVGRMNGGKYNHHKVTVSEPIGRPSAVDMTGVSTSIKICTFCKAQLGPGLPHRCNRQERNSNLEELVKQSSEKGREIVISSQLKEVYEAQGVSTKGGTVTISTRGAPIQTTLGKSRDKPSIKFTTEALNKLQSSIGVSDRKMNIVGNFIRIECGRASVVNLQSDMLSRNKKFAPHFEGKMIKQTEYANEGDEGERSADKKKKKIAVEVYKPAAMVKNVEDFVSQVLIERQLRPDEVEIQVGIDEGQNLLKILMTIKHKEEGQVTERKKTKYSAGFNPNKFKLSGVKKLFVLFASPTCERYDNLVNILEGLGLEAVEFGFSCDLKMILILCGKQCAASKHCCPFCDGCAPWLEKKVPSTIGSLWSSYNAYTSDGAIKKNAMKYNNVINPPLLTGSDSALVLSVVYFPELHVLIGIVSKLVREMENSIFPTQEEGQKFMESWMSSPSVNVRKTVYHGQANFVGNMAKLLLKKLDSLRMAVNKQDEQVVIKAEPFIQTLEKLEAVRQACFGQLVEAGYSEKISIFSSSYRSLGISIPLKVHVLECHLEEFLELKGGVYGAGFWSEQAPESAHREFEKEWENNRVIETHPDYLKKLVTQVVRFNGKHL